MLSRLALLRSAAGPARVAFNSSRTLFWNRDPFSDMRSMLREMEHQAEHVERLLTGNTRITSKLPHLLGSVQHT
jgi:hypothetical protein